MLVKTIRNACEQRQFKINQQEDSNMQTFDMLLPLYNQVGGEPSLQDYVNYFAKNVFCTKCPDDCIHCTKINLRHSAFCW